MVKVTSTVLFDTLRLLVEGAGTLQKQESLMDRLWPDVVVEQNNLQYNISHVRRALADAPGIEIQTVRGQGYRLVANHGPNGGQLVFHFHVHIFGGKVMSQRMGNMPRAAETA